MSAAAVWESRPADDCEATIGDANAKDHDGAYGSRLLAKARAKEM